MTMIINNKFVFVLIIMGTVVCNSCANCVEDAPHGSDLFSWIRPPQSFCIFQQQVRVDTVVNKIYALIHNPLFLGILVYFTHGIQTQLH